MALVGHITLGADTAIPRFGLIRLSLVAFGAGRAALRVDLAIALDHLLEASH
jgi:hypothetical protein